MPEWRRTAMSTFRVNFLFPDLSNRRHTRPVLRDVPDLRGGAGVLLGAAAEEDGDQTEQTTHGTDTNTVPQVPTQLS